MVKDNQEDLKKELEIGLDSELTSQPGKRFALTAVLLGFKALELAVNFIKTKKPDFNPTPEDKNFIAGLATSIIEDLVKKQEPTLNPKLEDTKILVGMLQGIFDKTKHKNVQDFVADAKDQIKKLLGIKLKSIDEDKIKDKATAVFSQAAGTTLPSTSPSAESIFSDTKVKEQITSTLRDMYPGAVEGEENATGRKLSRDEQISTLKSAIRAPNSALADLLDDLTKGKKKSVADLSQDDQKKIDDEIIPAVVDHELSSGVLPPEAKPPDDQTPSPPPRRRRRRQDFEEVETTPAAAVSDSAGEEVILVPRCRLFRFPSAGRTVILRPGGLSRGLGSRYYLLEE